MAQHQQESSQPVAVQDVLQGLIQRAKEHGRKLSYQTIMDSLQTFDLPPEQIDTAYEMITDSGIKLVDERVAATEAPEASDGEDDD